MAARSGAGALRRVVVLDRGLEMLADRRRLSQLLSKPTEQAYPCGVHV